jgi:hypothetical protein
MASKPKPPPIDSYLQYSHEGDPDSANPNLQFWVASLSEGGHTASIYEKAQEAVEARAREILAARGIEV